MEDTEFQSTCPVRGTTFKDFFKEFPSLISIHVPRTGHDCYSSEYVVQPGHFNPRAPYGARPCGASALTPGTNFNPRAPYGARRNTAADRPAAPRNFNPRAPYGARRSSSLRRPALFYFNPRAPYGARLRQASSPATATNFNPRAPYGARHGVCRKMQERPPISTHVPRTGHDRRGKGARSRQAHFNPRAPYGARR